EVKAASKIKGEHIVRVLDVGELEGRGLYLVMEYVEGINLVDLIAAEGPPPPPTAVEIVLQASDALAQAHAAGIVHRNVKPSNLFVTTRSNGQPLVKLLDFGISKVKDAEKKVTLATSPLGSPPYMSPEQLTSSPDIDGRSDIWSVGVVLFELLTGALPFVGDSAADVSARIHEAPPPSLRNLRPEVSEGLERVVLHCLEKDRARRYATMAQLVEALRPFAARASGASERPPRPKRGAYTLFVPRGTADAARTRRAMALSGLAVVAVVAVVAIVA